ncbi:MAG: hypothetical protein QM772_07020 [Ottowia sp.]|uniref:hypothetical protein n=1 Tax=Ottowia sp. TaxID=1898956 RepID=UPI0039E3ADC1
MQPAEPLYPISLNTAAVLTGRSMRTWQRRIEEGLVPRLGDGRGALVPFAAVRPALAVDLSDEDVQMLVRADQGEAAAQADVGALFALAALKEKEAPAGRKAASALQSRGGGGGAASYRRCTSSRKRRSAARRMRCTGWACCTPPACARVTAARWR